jgi:sugar/nucleoside kinase (ribokinase family)
VRPLAIVGNLSRDVVDNRVPRVGGAPYYATRALRALEQRSVVLTKCTREDRSALVRPLVALGIPVEWRPAETTASFSFGYRGDHRVMNVDALGPEWTERDVRTWMADALRDVPWVHVGALARHEFPARTLAALARGRRLSLDGQGLARPPRTGPLELDGEFDRDTLRHVTVLKLAEEEARALVGSAEPDALRGFGVAEVVVTFGSRGSLLVTRAAALRVEARPIAADPTGSGDAFAAAYMAARSGGHAPGAAARRATAVVASVLRQRELAARHHDR